MWLVGAAVLTGVWTDPFRVEVSGGSMAPGLRHGDWLIATRRGRIRRGAVVVLAHPGRTLDLVKRVAAVPGDRGSGRALGSDEFLVIGDNEAASTDGRTFGPVRSHAIEGVVRFRYWPDPGPVR
jgi:type IV secretory pathway protease TraF